MEPILVPVRFPNGETAELRLVKDDSSFTGYSLISLQDEHSPGVPASIFLVAVMVAYRKLLSQYMALKVENDRLRKEIIASRDQGIEVR